MSTNIKALRSMPGNLRQPKKYRVLDKEVAAAWAVAVALVIGLLAL
jgi:hypothetical protein